MENSPPENKTQTPTGPPSTTDTDHPRVSLNLSQIVSLCAAGLLVSFFLPWINFLGLKLSGFELGKSGDKGLLLWLIPVLGALVIFAGITRRSQKMVAQLVGVLPFFVLGYGIYREGKDLLQVLGMGAYIALLLGAVLFVLPRWSK